MSAELMSMTLNAAKYSSEHRIDWYTIKSIVHKEKLTFFHFHFSRLKIEMEIEFNSEIEFEEFDRLCRQLTIKEFEKKQKSQNGT